MSDIFLSYAQADSAWVAPLIKFLRSQGWNVWWDGMIAPGKVFDRAIEVALNEARCVVVVWSRNSVQSEWVRNEATEGHRRGVLIPIIADEVLPPLPFRLINSVKLSKWTGESSDPRLQVLRSSIKALIERSRPAQGLPKLTAQHSYIVPGVLLIIFFSLLCLYIFDDIRSRRDVATPQRSPEQAVSASSRTELDSVVASVKPEPASPRRFIASQDVIEDTALGLVWQKTQTEGLTWHEAVQHCQTLTLPDYPSGWRLPNKDELSEVLRARLDFDAPQAYLVWNNDVVDGNGDGEPDICRFLSGPGRPLNYRLVPTVCVHEKGNDLSL